MRARERRLTRSVQDTLEEVQMRLLEWRNRRRRGAPIPPEIWASATNLAREHGTAKVARRLRLDYYALRKRVEPVPEAQRYGSPFVELFPSLSGGTCECTLELEHPKGARLRIQIKGGGEPDLAAVTRAFWAGRG